MDRADIPPDVRLDRRRDPGLSAGMLLIFGPLLAVGAFTALLAALAGSLGWYPQTMFAIALGMGALVGVLGAFLVHRQRGDRLAAERALQNVEARVAGILNSAMDAVVAVDEEQRIVVYNPAAEKVFFWPRAAVVGQPLGMLIPERHRAAHRGHIARFGETGVTSRRMGDATLVVGLRANGEEFPIEASISQHSEDGRKLYTVILRDVTQRKTAEERLARSESRLRGILDSAMDAIVTVDESQKVVLFNRAAEAVFGCPRSEAIGAPLSWFIPERYRAHHADLVRRFGETDTASRRMAAQRIVMGLRRSGEEFPIDASISHITEGGSKYYTVILRDVTARVRADEALRASKEELEQMALMAHTAREQEKSRIARELHDELGQALTALKMDVNWMRERLGADEAGLAGKLGEMQALLDSTVAATRRISADLRPMMLDDLGLAPAAEWLVQNFSQRTGIRAELDLRDPEIDLPEPYATAVFRILQESLTNVSRHARAKQVDVTLSVDEDLVRLVVRDDGVGFAADAPRKEGSFGLLGLRERAYLLGGETRVDSAPGRGTRIEIIMPVREKAAP